MAKKKRSQYPTETRTSALAHDNFFETAGGGPDPPGPSTPTLVRRPHPMDAAPITPPRRRPKERYALNHPYRGSNGVKRRLYHLLLFGFPMMYFTRMAKLLEEAWICSQEIGVIAKTGNHTSIGSPPYWPRNTPPERLVHLSPALRSFMKAWEAFINSLLQEWTTIVLVSSLLIPAIVSLFQSPVVSTDPLLKSMSSLSLACAIISGLYGILYTNRFGSLKDVSQALSWTAEAQNTLVSIWWSILVVLAIPFVWLAWSAIFFVIAVFMLAWKSSTGGFDKLAWIMITALCVLAFVHFAFTLRTLQRYGRLNLRYVDDKSDTELDEVDGGPVILGPDSGLCLTNIHSSPY